MSGFRQPDLSYVIPGWSENRWSDLLASLIKTDPDPMEQLIGAAPDDGLREIAVPGQTSQKSDRLDLLLRQGQRQLAAIEVKVLSTSASTNWRGTRGRSLMSKLATSCTWRRCL